MKCVVPSFYELAEIILISQSDKCSQVHPDRRDTTDNG